ncbi:E3 ubiquitin-protein ligase SINA-like 10 [Triticum aestivum]|uniref:E3 ubiquitin-protein ligase SINA-like 10 n=1 Tax=Triticum aestivum TaxID=4565 RepID=UPI001D03465A|nr:E3 ubiquitin-protein ligase SINA-like 10 [Triticum aestivum]
MSSDSDYPAMRRARSPRRHRRRWRSDVSEDEEEPHRRSSSSSGRSSSSSISRSSSSSSDSSSGRSSNSRRRSRRSYRSRSRSRSPRHSRSRSPSRSRSHRAAADNEFTVRIDNYDDLFNCALCHGLLSSPVYECGDGHLTCHRCHDLDRMPCIRCGSKEYTRSRAVATMIRSVRFACPNREHGCAASLPRLGVEDHERSCRYEPCFCPVCKRAFVPVPILTRSRSTSPDATRGASTTSPTARRSWWT